jgi:hypothetical protein
MSDELVEQTQPVPRRPSRRWLHVFLALAVLWVVAAYVVVPALWKHYARSHPSFDENPRVTHTSDRHPGDPLNVSLIGTQEQINAIMQTAKWYPAAALGLRSDIRIAEGTVLSRPDVDAPVSSRHCLPGLAQ